MCRVVFALTTVLAVVASAKRTKAINADDDSALGLIFSRLDENGDGRASKAEMHTYLKGIDSCKLGNYSHAVATVAMYDANHDDFLSFGELADVMPRMAAPAVGPLVPQQIHVSLLSQSSAMLMWVTMHNVLHPQARVGPAPNTLNQVIEGTSHTYSCGDGWHGHIHQVEVTNLAPSQVLYYSVGDPSANMSDVYHFAMAPAAADDAPIVVGLFGDMGTAIPAGFLTCELIEADHQVTPFNLYWHVGDIAYASTQMQNLDAAVKDGAAPLRWEIESVWDAWANQVQPMAAYVPYMTAVGNHEQFYNFSAFLNRFRMPAPWGGDPQNIGDAIFWFSYDFGKIHFIAMSTEHDYSPGSAQYQWLQQDLAAAVANRAAVPWIVLTGHRPMYCTDESELNDHMPGGRFQVTIEPLMVQYQVDLYVCGHMHMYERVHPVVNGTTMQIGDHYVAGNGIPHVVQGNAGCFEDLNFLHPAPTWSAYRAGKFGYGRMTVANVTHMHYEFRNLDTKETIDEFWITKPALVL